MPDPLKVPRQKSEYLAKKNRYFQGVRCKDTGDEVKRLQEALLALEIKLPNFGADGIFGKETDGAVRNFQRTHKDILVIRNGSNPPLRVDGIVGPKTALAINCALARAKIWFDEFKYEWTDDEGEQKVHCTSSTTVKINPKRKEKVAVHVRRNVTAILYNVALVPQPTKESCWAASMAMLVGWARKENMDAESIAREAGVTLYRSYDYDNLWAVRNHFGIEEITMPSSPYYSLVFSPEEWYKWLKQFGPLYISTIGAPLHAIVVRGISGDLTPEGTTFHILNPWNIYQNPWFDNDPVDFHPPNIGATYTQSYADFAQQFGYIRDYIDHFQAQAGKPIPPLSEEAFQSHWRILYIRRN